MTQALSDKIALVTGGSSGIGRASSLAFAKAGAKVVVSDVNVSGGEETVQQIRQMGGEASFVRVDVSSAAEVENLIDTTVSTYGRIDCAHNNAGIIGENAPTHEFAEDVWDKVMNVNLKGMWLCMKYEIRKMLAQGGGAIVNTSSVLGTTGAPGLSAYVASKFGISGLTKTAALEYARHGIRINSIHPGYVDTEIFRSAFAVNEEIERHLTDTIPLGRVGTPEEIGDIVVWLCSDASAYVVGHGLQVNGGMITR